MVFSVEIPVRFADVDAMQHVNNAVYATWMETARTEYYRTLTGFQDLADLDLIVARAEIDYLRGVRYAETVTVDVWPSHVGRSSFHFAYRMRVGGETVAKGLTVQVAFDYLAGAKKPIDEKVRIRLEAALSPPA